MNTIPTFRGIWFRPPQGGPKFPLHGWGYNTFWGLLGFFSSSGSRFYNNINNQVSTPILISNLNINNWRKVILGAETVIGITDKNTMLGWGNNLGNLWKYNSSSLANRVNSEEWRDFSFCNNVGQGSILAIQTNGTLWGWGRNLNGELGLGDTINRSAPVQVGASDQWIAVSISSDTLSSRANALAIQGTGGSGSLWSWGSNDYGQLGQGLTTSVNVSSPVQVGGLNTWAKVYSCNESSFAIRNNKTLWAWGLNSSGRLGLRDTIRRSSPVQVGALTDWVKVLSSQGSTVGLRENGTLWAWGSNATLLPMGGVDTFTSGILGINPSMTNVSSPVQIGTATDWSDFELSCSFLSPAILALKTNGTLWVWGSNEKGLLARPCEILPSFNQVGALNTWRKIEAGYSTSYAIRSDGSLWGWGQLKTTISERTSPVRVGSLTGWIDVKCQHHNLAIRSAISNGATSGSLFAWGYNDGGQLGLGDTAGRNSPVSVGAATDWSAISVSRRSTGFLVQGVQGHSCAIKTNGTLWAWGLNASGQLGVQSVTSFSSPVQVGSGSTGPWSKVACSKQSTIAIQQDGTIWSWGYAFGGILGRTGSSTSSPVRIGSLTGWTQIECGDDHALAIRSDGTLWAWGQNGRGQLGRVTASTRTSSPVQIGANTDWRSIKASSYVSFAIRSDNTLWGWGRNYYSTLDGTSASKSSPVQIGTATGWTAAAAGPLHLLALTTTGTLWARGSSEFGQLGIGTFPAIVGGLTNPAQITGITASSLARTTQTYCNLRGFLQRM